MNSLTEPGKRVRYTYNLKSNISKIISGYDLESDTDYVYFLNTSGTGTVFYGNIDQEINKVVLKNPTYETDNEEFEINYSIKISDQTERPIDLPKILNNDNGIPSEGVEGMIKFIKYVDYVRISSKDDKHLDLRLFKSRLWVNLDKIAIIDGVVTNIEIRGNKIKDDNIDIINRLTKKKEIGDKDLNRKLLTCSVDGSTILL